MHFFRLIFRHTMLNPLFRSCLARCLFLTSRNTYLFSTRLKRPPPPPFLPIHFCQLADFWLKDVKYPATSRPTPQRGVFKCLLCWTDIFCFLRFLRRLIFLFFFDVTLPQPIVGYFSNYFFKSQALARPGLIIFPPRTRHDFC